MWHSGLVDGCQVITRYGSNEKFHIGQTRFPLLNASPVQDGGPVLEDLAGLDCVPKIGVIYTRNTRNSILNSVITLVANPDLDGRNRDFAIQFHVFHIMVSPRPRTKTNLTRDNRCFIDLQGWTICKLRSDSVSKYRNFDLEIGRLGDQYRSRVLDADAGNCRECLFTWSSLQVDLNDLLTTLHIATQHRRDVLAISNPPQPPAGEDPKRHLIVLPESRLVARKKLQEFGEALFKRVFAGPVAEALRTNAKEAKDAKLGLRVRLHLDNLPEFQDVPWEYLYD